MVTVSWELMREVPRLTQKCKMPRFGYWRVRESETNNICASQGGGVGSGAGRKIVQNAIFHGKRHDNKILKVKI